MSYKHVGTVADLMRFRCSLRVECDFCGAAATLSGAALARLPAHTTLDRLAPRLKCRRCGRKAAKVTVLDPV